MRLLPYLLIAAGALAALVLLMREGSGGSEGSVAGEAGSGSGEPAGPLAGDPAGAREIQDARPPAPPTPQQQAWRWTWTILGIVVVTSLVIFGLVLIARAIWDL
ncbi:hypothetical protein [Nostocoides veronense]|uniref:Uncharacterized protein n=1 Tax=Nostocoides veronense TaxID=330836 RepID=A0ABN2LAH9_9MICO